MKENEINNLEKVSGKRSQEDIDVGIRKGFNTTIINMFNDLKGKNEPNEGTTQQRNAKFKKLGSIEQVNTISELKSSPCEVNKRQRSAR